MPKADVRNCRGVGKSKREYDPMVENRLKDVFFRSQDLEAAGILKGGTSKRVGKRLADYQNGLY